MGIIATGNWGKTLFPGVHKFFGLSYAEYAKGQEWTQLFETSTSRKNFEEDVATTTFNLAAIKSEGAPVQYTSDSQSYISRYHHLELALGFVITRILVEDDQYDVAARKRSDELAFSMRQTKEVLGANVFNRGFNAAFPGGDGVSMLNAAHPNKAGGTWSNVLAVPADLSEASIEQAIIDIMKFKNDAGLQIQVLPMSLHIAPENVFEAERILKSPLRNNTNTNAINALLSMGKLPNGIYVNHYFTDPDAWFIKTDCKDSLRHFVRRPMEFTMDNEFDTDNAKYKATERYSFGWSDPRGIYGSPGV